jgi:hypothetical protein
MPRAVRWQAAESDHREDDGVRGPAGCGRKAGGNSSEWL